MELAVLNTLGQETGRKVTAGITFANDNDRAITLSFFLWQAHREQAPESCHKYYDR